MSVRAGKIVRLGIVGALVAVSVVAAAGPSSAEALGPYPGSLPDTDSAVTYCVVAEVGEPLPDGCDHGVPGSGEFVGLRVHVNQTANLNTQGVSIDYSWPGHVSRNGGTFGSISPYGTAVTQNFMHVMQCWGDAVTSPAADPEDVTQAQNVNYVPGDAGPPRENCEYGTSGKIDLTTAYQQGTRKADPVVAKNGAHYGTESVYTGADNIDTVDTQTGPLEVPFLAADGGEVPHQIGLVTTQSAGGTPITYQTIVNDYFDNKTTNEQPTNLLFGPDARGGTKFQLQNAADSRGLGCGAPRLGGDGVNACWLVLVPQGTLDLDGQSFDVSSRDQFTQKVSAFGSPLASTNWRNRIAIPLSFNPVQSACEGRSGSRSTFGSALASAALLSWQAKLCATTDDVFEYTQGTDAIARSTSSAGTPGFNVYSNGVDPSTVSAPVVYAPLTLSGISIGFVWDRALVQYQKKSTYTNFISSSPGAPIDDIKLNQRLVAKLLTYSYVGANEYRVLDSTTKADPDQSQYAWLKQVGSADPGYTPRANNPRSIATDPEFLQLNPDLAPTTPDGKGFYQALLDVNISFLQGPLFASDGIARLWQWVMSDRDARAFMAGVSDPWGARVDPWFSTNADDNPNGYAFETNVDGLPYADPWQGIPNGTSLLCVPPTLSFSDIQPQAADSATVAKNILTDNVLGKTRYDCDIDPVTGRPPSWLPARTTSIVVPGMRGLAGITDTASAGQYGVTQASLQTSPAVPATDTTEAVAPTFAAPDDAGIAAAAAHLVSTGVDGVAQPALDVAQGASKDAYPLSIVTYAGVTTNGMSSADCAAYATLLDYASGTGQASGTSVGQLPAGYVPLPAAQRAQTAAAARTVAACSQVRQPVAEQPDETAPPVDTTPSDLGGSETVSQTPTSDDVPAASAPVSSAPTTSAPQVSLATRQTKPDPSVFAYVVPIAALIGLLAVLAAPLAGLRRRKPGSPG